MPRGIRILDELARDLESKKKTVKVPENWLDRLRSKRGIPTGDTPDLETFIQSIRNDDVQLPRPRRDGENQVIGTRRPRKQARPTRVQVCPPSTASTSAAAGASTSTGVTSVMDITTQLETTMVVSVEEEAQREENVPVAAADVEAVDPAEVADMEVDPAAAIEVADVEAVDPAAGAADPPMNMEPIQEEEEGEGEETEDEDEEEELEVIEVGEEEGSDVTTVTDDVAVIVISDSDETVSAHDVDDTDGSDTTATDISE
ncbi:hypothetical protein RIF29_11346 [Crotalaria pallida]|uniref:Uncharacterized protein n=1 Tax=Crotalaria pallida TaxID=3830 RepID=A0AAN9IM17_CROPI